MGDWTSLLSFIKLNGRTFEFTPAFEDIDTYTIKVVVSDDGSPSLSKSY